MGEAVSESNTRSALKHQACACLRATANTSWATPTSSPVLDALNARDAVSSSIRPCILSRKLALPCRLHDEYVFDTTRAAVNLGFTGAIESFPRIRFVLAHAGGLMRFAWRPVDLAMIDARLEQLSPAQVYAGSSALYDMRCRHRRDDGLPCGCASPDHIVFGSAGVANRRVIAQAVKTYEARRCRRRSGMRSTAAMRCRFPAIRLTV